MRDSKKRPFLDAWQWTVRDSDFTSRRRKQTALRSALQYPIFLSFLANIFVYILKVEGREKRPLTRRRMAATLSPRRGQFNYQPSPRGEGAEARSG